MAKVSVIVPVYNVEKYLSRSIDSILSQTYKDLEIICINDGSTDKSADILRQYQNLDSRIVIFDTEHSCAASSRNLGIAKATGKYIMFVDGDDYIASNYVENMVKHISSTGAEVVISDYYTLNFWKDETADKYYYYWQYDKVPYTEEIVNIDANDSINFLYFAVPCWNKIFSADFLKSKRIEFPPIHIYEDVVFWGKVWLNLEKIAYTPRAYYFYRKKRPGSLTTKRDEDVYQVITIHKMLADLFREYNRYDDMKNILDYIMIRDFLSKLSLFPANLSKNLFYKIKSENYDLSFSGMRNLDLSEGARKYIDYYQLLLENEYEDFCEKTRGCIKSA